MWSSGDGAIKRVEEGGVVWSKGEFVDYVREVECWAIEISIQAERRHEAINIRTYHYGPNALQIPNNHALSP